MALSGVVDEVNWAELLSIHETDSARVSALIETLRSKPRSRTNIYVEQLCEYLEAHAEQAHLLGTFIQSTVLSHNTLLLLTESGVPGNKGFGTELFQRIERRLIPELEDPKDLRTTLRTFFSSDKDYKWINAVSDGLWMRLLASLGIGEGAGPRMSVEWATSLSILSHHISSLGCNRKLPIGFLIWMIPTHHSCCSRTNC